MTRISCASCRADARRQSRERHAYTIDPRGSWRADLDQNVDPTEWANYVRKSQDSLRTLAELTAGSPW